MEQFDFEIDLDNISNQVPTIIFGNSLQVMRHLPKESIDLIIADEGYPDLEKHRAIGTTTRLTKKFYNIVNYEETVPLYRILLKPKRHLYMWRPSLNRDSLQFWDLLLNPSKGLLIKNGFVFRKAIPCIKNFNGMGYSFRSAHERIILADNEPESEEIIFSYKRKGTMRKLNDLTLPDYFMDEWKSPRSKSKSHISEKPSKIYRKLIQSSSLEDEIVLEPFAGSFQAGIVNTKYEMKRRVIGIEMDKTILDDCRKNFREETGMELDVINYDELLSHRKNV